MARDCRQAARTWPLEQLFDAIKAMGWAASYHEIDGMVDGMVIGTSDYVEAMTEPLMLDEDGEDCE